MNPTISIVVTTYNGERYLQGQLDSIRDQTLTPDEVIILDDGSTDGTSAMIRSYIKMNGLSNWHLVQNEKNLGWKANFKKGFDLAQGDLILPSDQDDLWHPDKVEQMAGVMMEQPDIQVLCCNYNLFVDGSDKRAGEMSRNMINDGSVEQIAMTPHWYYLIRPGCTYCFRRTFYNSIVSRWDIQLPHDTMLWRYACMQGGLYLLNKDLIDFRRHGDNATSTFVWTRQNRLAFIREELWFQEEALKVCKEEERPVIESVMTFLNIRREVLENRRIWKWFRLLLHYRSFYITRLGLWADLVYAFR